MANVKKTIKVDVYPNTNEKSDQYGKYYGRIHGEATLGLRGLIDHITQHGTQYTRDVVTGVVIRLRDCIAELISEGQSVKIDGLGTLRPTLETKPADTAEDWNVQEHVEGLHIRFIPEGEKLDRLTSKEMLNKVVLEKAYEVSYRTITRKGKQIKVPVYTPVVKEDEQPEP